MYNLVTFKMSQGKRVKNFFQLGNNLQNKYIFTADKSGLMKERMRLEKGKKNENKVVDPKEQQKRKHPEEDKENQKRKKKQESTERAKEKEQNAKNKEEKRKKKEQEQEQQKMMLEARKAQAISRWVASATATTDDDVTIVNDMPSATFTPQPLRQNSSLNRSPMISAFTAYSSDRTPNSTPESVQSTMQESSVANLALPASSTGAKSLTRTPDTTSAIATPESMQLKHRSSAANPRPTGTKTKQTCQPKRGLHFQSAIAEDSDDEIEEEEEEEQILEDPDVSSSDCCKEQRMEIKALRKRLERVHKRLNIACKFPLPNLESSMFSAAHAHMYDNTKLSTFSSTQCTCKATKMTLGGGGAATEIGLYSCS